MASAFEKWLGTLKCEDDYNVPAAYSAGYAAAVERMGPWMKHDEDCVFWDEAVTDYDEHAACTCGLAEAMKGE